jgi:hypothetical protein
LESFKTIDLRAYAAAHGYEFDRKESWRGSSVMRHPNGDKVIIKRGTDGHYVYFSVRTGQGDSGTIIDFIQHRQGFSLGALRKELRSWLGQPPVPVPDFLPLRATARDRLKVEAAFAKTRDAVVHPYLEDERAIPGFLMRDPRFKGRIRIDRRGNAIFPHFDFEGLCGYEIKNRGFTGFSPGGTKGLWRSRMLDEDSRLVFAESAIDALSYAVLFEHFRTTYVSVGGKLSPNQTELIRNLIAAMPTGTEIVAAMDADADGANLAESVRKAYDLTAREDLKFVREEPFGFKDWNDQLRATPVSRLPHMKDLEPAP